MRASTRRNLRRVAVGGCVLAAVGLNVGWWAYDRAAFFLPNVTARRLRQLERAARRSGGAS